MENGDNERSLSGAPTERSERGGGAGPPDPPDDDSVRIALCRYQAALDRAEVIPSWPAGPLLPGSRWVLRYLLVRHIHDRLERARRRSVARRLTGHAADGDPGALEQFDLSLPPVRHAKAAYALLVATVVLLLPTGTYFAEEADLLGELADGVLALDPRETVGVIQEARAGEMLDALLPLVMALVPALFVLFMAFLVKRSVLLSPDGAPVRLRAIAVGADGAYAAERALFASLCARPPREFPLDLAFFALLLAPMGIDYVYDAIEAAPPAQRLVSNAPVAMIVFLGLVMVEIAYRRHHPAAQRLGLWRVPLTLLVVAALNLALAVLPHPYVFRYDPALDGVVVTEAVVAQRTTTLEEFEWSEGLGRGQVDYEPMRAYLREQGSTTDDAAVRGLLGAVVAVGIEGRGCNGCRYRATWHDAATARPLDGFWRRDRWPSSIVLGPRDRDLGLRMWLLLPEHAGEYYARVEIVRDVLIRDEGREVEALRGAAESGAVTIGAHLNPKGRTAVGAAGAET